MTFDNDIELSIKEGSTLQKQYDRFSRMPFVGFILLAIATDAFVVHIAHPLPFHGVRTPSPTSIHLVKTAYPQTMLRLRPASAFAASPAVGLEVQPQAPRHSAPVASLAAALSGPLALPAAAGIAAAAGTLAYVHQAYIFSLSYGLAMAAIGSAVLLSSPTSMLLKVKDTIEY